MTRAAESSCTEMPRVDIVDVGHGSCVAIRGVDYTVLIDTGPGGALLEYLRTESISRVDAVVISHADADHIGGLVALLCQPISVGQIIWNGDAIKGSNLWKDLVYLLDDLDRQGIVSAQQDACEGVRIEVGDSNIEIVILGPNLVLRRLGAGATDRDGQRIVTNSVSVVAQVIVNGEALLLTTGDLDHVGFAHLMAANTTGSLHSRYLVLPHHGGLLGTAATTADTIKSLISAVAPEAIFISNGRGKWRNPRADVVAAIREGLPNAPIVCTQLSEECAIKSLIQNQRGGPYSAGWSRGHSCAGTISLTSADGTLAKYDNRQHASFIQSSVPNHLC